jgi:hypothetical protein
MVPEAKPTTRAAVPSHSAERGLGIIAADGVVEDIDPARAGQRFEAELQVLFGVVDALIGAKLAREGKLLIRGGDSDDARAHQLRDFDGGKSRPSGRAENGNGLARLQSAAILEPVQRGAEGDGESGRLVVAHPVGNGNGVLRLGHDQLAATVAAGAGHDPLLELQIGNAGAEASDGTRDLRPRRERERRRDLVFVAEDERVGEVEPDRRNPDEDFAGPRLRLRGLFETECRKAPELGNLRNPHRNPSNGFAANRYSRRSPSHNGEHVSRPALPFPAGRGCGRQDR